MADGEHNAQANTTPVDRPIQRHALLGVSLTAIMLGALGVSGYFDSMVPSSHFRLQDGGPPWPAIQGGLGSMAPRASPVTGYAGGTSATYSARPSAQPDEPSMTSINSQGSSAAASAKVSASATTGTRAIATPEPSIEIAEHVPTRTTSEIDEDVIESDESTGMAAPQNSSTDAVTSGINATLVMTKPTLLCGQPDPQKCGEDIPELGGLKITGQPRCGTHSPPTKCGPTLGNDTRGGKCAAQFPCPIAMQPVGGVDNRLRVMVSYIAYAWIAGCADVRFYWLADRNCPALFDDLFEPIPGVAVLSSEPPKDVWISCYSVNPKGPSELSTFALRILRPRPAILAQVADLRKTLGEHYIAVHVRRTDLNKNYDADESFVTWARKRKGKVFVGKEKCLCDARGRRCL